VSDVAKAVTVCLKAPLVSVKGHIFNVGSDDENYRISQIGKSIQQHLPETEVLVKNLNEDPRNYRVSFEKIQRMLNFRVSKSVDDGVAEILHAIETGRISDWQSNRYSNIATLSENNRLIVARGT